MMLSFYSLLSTVISATMRELVRQQEYNGLCIIFHRSDQSRKKINVEKHTSPNESRMQINYSNVWIVWIVNCFLHFYDCLKYDFLLRPRKKVKTANKSRETRAFKWFWDLSNVVAQFPIRRTFVTQIYQ